MAGLACVGTQGVAHGSCLPAARVDGAGPLVAEVRALLSLRGVEPEGGPSCPVAAAQVTPTDGGVRVTVTDPSGRTETREVSDSVTATTVIESWARADIEAPLLEARAPEVTEPPSEPLAPPVLGAPPAERAPLPYSVGVALATSLGGDSSAWIEPELSGCFLWGPVCMGALLRGRFDLRMTGSSAELDTDRMGVDVLILAELPIDLGPVVLGPALGVGAGWLRLGYTGEEAQGQAVEVDAGGVRLEARIGLRIPIADDFALDVALRGDVSPLAHPAPFDEEGLRLAGEPLWSLSAGIGLRYGGP